jgi:hypothetical protein
MDQLSDRQIHSLGKRLGAVGVTSGVNAILSYCLRDTKLNADYSNIQTALRRFVAVCWLLKSNEMRGEDGKPMSLQALSKQPQIDCTRCALSLMAQDFGNKFGFHARVQKRVSAKENYAKAARFGWAKRRQRQSQ